MPRMEVVTQPHRVEIVWQDSFDINQTWAYLKDILHTVEKQEYYVKSLTWLVAETPTSWITASHIAEREDGLLVAGVMVIPKKVAHVQYLDEEE